MKSIIIILHCFVLSLSLAAQNVGIGTMTPAASAQLDVTSTSKGMLAPRMTQQQRGLIASPTAGLLIYQTDVAPGCYYYDGTAWVANAKGGNFFLPYVGTASTVGGAEFSISHTNTLGDAAYFNNTGTGSSLTTGAGHNKFNMTSGNTGIGIPNTLLDNPTLGRLVVRGSVGATVALFGDKAAGISLQSNIPSVGFNEYYNGGSKFISTGYGGKLAMFNAGGDLAWYVSNVSGAADAAMTLNQRFAISREGSLVIQGADAGYVFKDRSSTNYGGWNLYATEGRASFYRYNLGGNLLTIDSTGSLGLQGVTTPTAPLSFPNAIGNKIALWGDASGGHYGLGIQGSLLQIYSSANTADIAFGYGSSAAFTENARLSGAGNMHLGKYTSWASAADNRKITFGDGEFTYIGEVGADDRLEMRAGGFNFKDGDVFIGTNDFVKAAGYKLRVGGKIYSEEVRVQLQAAWPDYVFEKNYQKLNLYELEQYLADHKHLPNLPSAKEVEDEGQHLGEIQRKMLEKIEELSLYVIELKKEIDELRKEK